MRNVCHSPLQVVSPRRKASAAAAPVLQRWPEEKLCLGSAGMNYCIPKEAVRVNKWKACGCICGRRASGSDFSHSTKCPAWFSLQVLMNYSWSGIIWFLLKILIFSETNSLSKHLSKSFLWIIRHKEEMKSVLINLSGFLSSMGRIFRIQLFAIKLFIEKYFCKILLKFQMNN